MTNKTEVITTKTLSLAEAAKVELTPENVMETYPLETLTSLRGRRAFEIFANVELLKPYIDAIHKESTSTVYDFSKKTQYTACGSASKKVSSSRKAITDAIELSIKAEQDKVNQAKAAKKFVETEMNKTRDAVLAPRRAYDEEQAKIEQARVDEIQGRIDAIRNLGALTGEESKEALGALVDAVTEMIIDESFQEFAGTANEAKQEALNNLNNAIIAIAEKEQQEATRLALEAEQKKATIESRINNLKQIPLGFMGKTAKEISEKLESIKAYEPTAEDFDDRLDETKAAQAEVIKQLEFMLGQTSQMEEQAAFDSNSNDQHPDNCQGCPDYQGINCAITEAAAKEDTESITQLSEQDAPMYADSVADAQPTSIVESAMAEVCTETKQAEAARILIELTGGELSNSLAAEVVGLIDSGVVPHITFN